MIEAAPTARNESNWGRWGDDDERGALNLVDDSVRLQAIRAVESGSMYLLGYPLDAESPRTPKRNPVWRTTRISNHPTKPAGSSDDIITMHSQIGTHLDALCHYWGPDGLYNGVEPSTITSDGPPRLGIHNVGSIVTRALVVDVSARCPTGKAGWGHEVTRADIEEQLAAAGLTVRAGDAVLLHTGWSRQFAEDREVYEWGEPGIGPDAAQWLAEQDVVLVGADNFAVEAVPATVKGQGLVVHSCLLNRYGIYLLENLRMDEVVAARGTCAGLLVVTPLALTGGSGSPVTPVLIC